MTTTPANTVVDHLRRTVLHLRVAMTDGELLECFVARKEEAAFATLVERHGPMVMGVCRRVARDHHDAEDAFQATFLVLARKASSVSPRERVGNWLHGVAYRTALKARAMALKRRARERPMTEMTEPAIDSPEPSSEVMAMLDRELNGLPEIYRLPVLLCELEGKSIKEATRQLGWPQGTLAGRLARGRQLLARRLSNRGVVLSAGSLVSASVPTALMVSTVKAATPIAAGQAAVAGAVPVSVVALMDGVLKAMLITKLKVTVLLALTLAMAVVGTGGILYESQAQEPKVVPPTVPPTTVPPPIVPKDSTPLPPIGINEINLNINPPQPPTVEEMRQRYAKLQEELSHHLTAPQVQQRVQELEQELAAAKRRAEKAQREKAASAELEKVKAMLQHLATTYPDTDAGVKARKSLDELNRKTVESDLKSGLAPVDPIPKL